MYCIKYCRGQEMLLMSSDLTCTTCHVQVNLLPRQPNGDNLLSSSSMHIDRSCFTQYAVLFISEQSMTHACRRTRSGSSPGLAAANPSDRDVPLVALSLCISRFCRDPRHHGWCDSADLPRACRKSTGKTVHRNMSESVNLGQHTLLVFRHV